MNVLESVWSPNLQWSESAEMADVVVRLSHPDLKRRVARNAECVAWVAGEPGIAAGQLVLTTAGDAFHNFGRPGVEGQGGWQHHPHRFFGSIRKSDAMAYTFSVKVNAGLGGHGDMGDAGGGHGVLR